MDLHQIEYFMKVAQLQHMTQAADALHVAQPALSKTIKTLEEDLGTPLFDRTGNRIHLNPAGEIFMEYADDVLASTQNMRRSIEEYKDLGTATVSISMNTSFELIYHAIRKFKDIYPGVKFQLNFPNHGESTLKKEYDITLTGSPVPAESDSCYTILKERIMLGVPWNHPLAREKEVHLADLRNVDFLFTTPMNSVLNEIIFMQCRLHGFEPNIIMEAMTRGDVIYAVSTGLGAIFAPEITWYHMINENKYCLIPIVDPTPTRCINMRWKTQGYVSKAAVHFREFLLDFLPSALDTIAEEHHVTML